MSGGIAYVYDTDGDFETRCNLELVDLDELSEDDELELRLLIEEHLQRTGSLVARKLLSEWSRAMTRFVKVMPRDYKRALAELAERDAVSVEA
jgi:glutamate synthase domain-containing protein 3